MIRPRRVPGRSFPKRGSRGGNFGCGFSLGFGPVSTFGGRFGIAFGFGKILMISRRIGCNPGNRRRGPEPGSPGKSPSTNARESGRNSGSVRAPIVIAPVMIGWGTSGTTSGTTGPGLTRRAACACCKIIGRVLENARPLPPPPTKKPIGVKSTLKNRSAINAS